MKKRLTSDSVVKSLAALAQTTRLGIFRLLVEAGPTGLAAGEIGAALKVAPATLSFHLKELAAAQLITASQQSRYIYYSAHYAHMNALLAFLTENCCARDDLACAPASACTPTGCTPALPAASSLARSKPLATHPSPRAKTRTA